MSKEWAYLLFDEFFDQGDLERDAGLPIQFLCDRETTNVASSQPGFINFITIPLWTVLAEVMPGIRDFVDGARENALTY